MSEREPGLHTTEWREENLLGTQSFRSFRHHSTGTPGPQHGRASSPHFGPCHPRSALWSCFPVSLTRLQGPEQGRTWARCRGSRGGDLRVPGNRQSYKPMHTRPLSINPWRGHVGFSEAARPAECLHRGGLTPGGMSMMNGPALAPTNQKRP